MGSREVSADSEQGSVASVVADAGDGLAAPALHEAVLLREPHRVHEIFKNLQWSSLNLSKIFECCWFYVDDNSGFFNLWGQKHRFFNLWDQKDRPFKFYIWLSTMLETDRDGLCAIHLAVKLGYCDIIDKFLELAPWCLDIRSKDYKTALHVAIKHDQLQVVRKLLQERKKKDGIKMVSSDRDSKGNTAFHIAAKKNVQPEIVEELLRWPGVNLNAVNKEGKTPLDIALHFARTPRSLEASPNHRNSVEIKKILEEVGACRSNSMQLQDKENKSMEVDTLVASLIATITFAAIFQVPGGIEDGKEAKGGKSPIQLGAAKLALEPYFMVFLFSDILALFTSLIVVVAWLFRRRVQTDKRLQYLSALSLGISVTCAGIAFLCAAILVVIPPHLKKFKTTHKKEFGEYGHLYSIMAASVLLPFSICTAAVYVCFVSDVQIIPRLTNPSPRYWEFRRGLFVYGSVVISVIFMVIYVWFQKTAY